MEAIDIMPKTQGSGPEGTQELLSLGKPILAALNLTPVGRGLTAAVATMAMIPEESEAGLLMPIGMIRKVGSKIKTQGMSIFPDSLLHHEIPTDHWSKFITKDNMADAIQKTSIGDVSSLPKQQKANAIAQLTETKEAQFLDLDANLAKQWEIDDVTNAIYAERYEAYPKGVVAVRPELSFKDMMASLVHEYTHVGDDVSLLTRKTFIDSPKNIPYKDRIHEVKAFVAGSRQKAPDAVTNPDSADFLHPLISYTDGEFGNTPLVKYVNAMKKRGVPYDIDEINQYAFGIQEEINRLSLRADENPSFKKKLDDAFADVPLHYESMIYSDVQVKARREGRVKRYKVAKKKKDEMEVEAELAAYALERDARLAQYNKDKGI